MTWFTIIGYVYNKNMYAAASREEPTTGGQRAAGGGRLINCSLFSMASLV